MEKLSPEAVELLENTFKVRRLLEQVFSKEVVDYILILITADCAHKKFLNLTEESE